MKKKLKLRFIANKIDASNLRGAPDFFSPRKKSPLISGSKKRGVGSRGAGEERGAGRYPASGRAARGSLSTIRITKDPANVQDRARATSEAGGKSLIINSGASERDGARRPSRGPAPRRSERERRETRHPRRKDVKDRRGSTGKWSRLSDGKTLSGKRRESVRR